MTRNPWRLVTPVACALLIFSFPAVGLPPISSDPALPEKAVKVLGQLAEFEASELAKQKEEVAETRLEVTRRMKMIMADVEASGASEKEVASLKESVARWERRKSIRDWPAPFAGLYAAYRNFEERSAGALDAKIAAKRKEVAKYLGGVLDETAKSADLDGALAVDSLIKELNAKAAMAKKSADRKPRSQGRRPKFGESTKRVLDPQRFSLGGGQSAEATYSFNLEAGTLGPAVLHIGVGRASDDTGDGGLTYQLIDPRGVRVSAGFLNGTADWMAFPVKVSGRYQLRLADRDTDSGGESPGNSGSIEVWVEEKA